MRVCVICIFLSSGRACSSFSLSASCTASAIVHHRLFICFYRIFCCCVVKVPYIAIARFNPPNFFNVDVTAFKSCPFTAFGATGESNQQPPGIVRRVSQMHHHHSIYRQLLALSLLTHALCKSGNKHSMRHNRRSRNRSQRQHLRLVLPHICNLSKCAV